MSGNGGNADVSDQGVVNAYADISCRFELAWRSPNALHCDCCFEPRLNLWQDYFPPELETLIMGRAVGESVILDCNAGSLVPRHLEEHCVQVPLSLFQQYSMRSGINAPQPGRFYPKKFIAGSHGINRQDVTPLRVTRVDDELGVDLNHPLSSADVSLTTTIMAINSGNRQCGSSRDIAKLLTTQGPGMQARWNNQPTDFWSDKPFDRIDTDSDAGFYEQPRLVDHIDRCASRQVGDLYQRLLNKGDVVLDLMASWNSHLPEALDLSELTGLGMNQKELESNPELDCHVIHDLNECPVLPFESEKFNAILCTVSIEYLVNPLEVFSEIHRVLKPGGRFIVTFSSRWFPTKAINIWTQLHDYERMGLVLEYFMLSERFTDLRTQSIRGLPRPADDKYANRYSTSDPVFAVWGTRHDG